MDKNSVVAKFNPAKRFHLNIASYGGAVTVYDIQSKKIYFQQKDAHSAPCRDIAVPLEIPDRLMSVGFDSTIKIFDTRYKRTGLSIESSCPFSTINTTHCGGYFVVGNLKGEVISYDLRNIKSHLASFRAEDSAINRVLIVPNSAYTEKDISMMSQQSNSPKVPLNQEPLPATSNLNSDYLFMEEVIGHQRRISDFSTNFQSRVSSTSNRGSTSSRISDNFEMQFIGNMLNDLSGDLNDNDTKTESLSKTLDVSFINADRLKRRSIRSFDISEKSRLLSRKSATGPNLENINEEVTTASENDKENNSLTLNSKSKKEEDFRKQPMEDNPNIKIINATIPEQTQEKNEIVGDNISDIVSSISTPQMSTDMKDEFNLMHNQMNSKFSELHQLINYDMVGNHIELTTYIFNVKRELQQKIKMVEECVGMLMLDNPIINQVLDLQEENQNLRKQLNDAMNRGSK